MTENKNDKKHIAILGGGPSGLFLFKRLIEANDSSLAITIFERKNQLGAGMPYSSEGANKEHITNVSDNEIPVIVNSIEDWIKTAPKDLLSSYHINNNNFNSNKVLPRLFFGAYLAAQFDLLLAMASDKGIQTKVYLNCEVIDIQDHPEEKKVTVFTVENGKLIFDKTVVCIGHRWPKKYEGKIPGYFDSPYPPAKLKQKVNHTIGIKGSSLTAVDAVRTLARTNGEFIEDKQGNILYKLHKGSERFKLILHSRNGLLPSVRFHLEDSHLHHDCLLTAEEISNHRKGNNGFLSLDFIFEYDFKAVLKEKDPVFYNKIKELTIEEFVDLMMGLREKLNPFQLLIAEYQEAEKSIIHEESIYWKEMLAVLSFAMNHPAKYMSAEDMLRLQKVLMPLISVVIAFVPQGSCRELIALYRAGLIELVTVGDDSEVMPKETGGADYQYIDENGQAQRVHFSTFIDAVGQAHLPFGDFPFQRLIADRTISEAKLKFADPESAKALLDSGYKKIEKEVNGEYFLVVPGLAINDDYQVLDELGAYNDRIYIMAVPYIGGFNPDYSGLDFCEAASARIVKSIVLDTH